MVMDGRMLYTQLAALVSGAACAQSLQVEDVDLDEVAGCQLLKPGPVPSLLLPARFHQSPSFISLGASYCDTIHLKYSNYSSDNRQ